MLTSIRSRLIAICVAIVALAMLVLTSANFLKVRSDTYGTLDIQMGQLADSHADNIADWVKAKKSVAGSLKLALAAPEPIPLIAAAKEAGAFDGAYIGFPDKPGLFLHAMPEGYQAKLRPWYIKAEQAGTPVLTLPYVDASTKKLVVTFAEPIGPKGAATAVIGADVELGNVVRNVSSIKPTPSSFAFLVDSNGIVITHPRADLALKPVADIDNSLSAAGLIGLERDRRSSTAKIDGREDLLFVRKIEGTDWLLVVCIDKAEATRSIGSMLYVSAIATIAMILLAALLLTVSITRTLRRLGIVRNALEDIASGNGDLTRRLDATGKDELAQIARAFNHFTEKIATVLREIRLSSESVKTSSNEIAIGNLDLSNRTEQQAGSLEETASAMEQLTSTVKQNADNARAASQLATSASTVAIEGGTVVGQVVETMSAINDSSKQIVEIISVIDGIAFQTNILALNAAVEAARAGEQGRGFAVVASEVRSLAQRSAAAAREIKTLISDSVLKVDAGSKLVSHAGETMKEIVTSVKRVTDIVSEISAAGQEQSAGIEEVNRAITEMDAATQQNAALVEQAAAAAQSLQDQAVSLAQAVAGFKLEDGQPPAAALQAHKPRQTLTAPVRAVTNTGNNIDLGSGAGTTALQRAAASTAANVRPSALSGLRAQGKAVPVSVGLKPEGNDWEQF